MWKSEFSLETAASPEAVWQILADVAAWPSWNPGYIAARLDGPDLRVNGIGDVAQRLGAGDGRL